MDINKKFFDEAVQLEMNIGYLYKVFSSVLTQDSTFWKEISKEEETHASMIRLLENQFIDSASAMINHLNVEKLIDINGRISAYIAKVEMEGINRREAFEIAIQLENQVYELQFREILQGINVPGIKDLFSVLAEKDKEHKDKLLRYVKENYV